MRAVIFANGLFNQSQAAAALLRPDDLLIAADGGLAHCLALGLTPSALIGDFDSLEPEDISKMEAAGVDVIRHPVRKNFTDLELALRFARDRGAEDILVLAALGARWDQTLANLLLPGAQELSGCRIALIDGPQEIRLVRSGERLEIHGQAGDTVSLVPIGGDAHGVTTYALEYPLVRESLQFGATRGISNVLLGSDATVQLERGLLLCVLIHHSQTNRGTND